ncbi:hypothetical protein [Pseudomonas weihenstephanensis]|uniref:hypothetical protein n=1 Tax=Pseudomonas weihenstephanensis TaxID=1608994 RepID=UPI000A95A86A|nr:hypothetical protein [Pseudomonas weihenstephanensis]
MCELVTENHWLHGVGIRVTDYRARLKSIHMSFDAPLDRVCEHTCYIHIVIDAPNDLEAEDEKDNVVFFVDSKAVERKLNGPYYKIFYDERNTTIEEIDKWVRSVVDFFQLMIFRIGMVCVDFAELRTFLSCCDSRTLRFEKILYDDHATVPFDKSSGHAYRTLYGCLSSRVGILSLGHYTDFADAIEFHNPDLVIAKIGMTFGDDDPGAMMLLGEPIVPKCPHGK